MKNRKEKKGVSEKDVLRQKWALILEEMDPRQAKAVSVQRTFGYPFAHV